MSYLVVFENILKNGKPGARFIIEYPTKKQFEDSKNSNHTIIESGISENRAHQLCDETPVNQIIDEFVQEATQENIINPDILKMKFATYLSLLIYSNDPQKASLKVSKMGMQIITGNYPPEVIDAYMEASKHHI